MLGRTSHQKRPHYSPPCYELQFFSTSWFNSMQLKDSLANIGESSKYLGMVLVLPPDHECFRQVTHFLCELKGTFSNHNLYPAITGGKKSLILHLDISFNPAVFLTDRSFQRGFREYLLNTPHCSFGTI